MRHQRDNSNVHAPYKFLLVRQQPQTSASKPAATSKTAAPSKTAKGHASSKTGQHVATASASAANAPTAKKGGISGAAVGAIVGVIALLILLAAAAFWRRRLSQKRRERRRVSIRVGGETLNANSYAPAPDNSKDTTPTEKTFTDASLSPLDRELPPPPPVAPVLPAPPPMAALSVAAPLPSQNAHLPNPFTPAPPYEMPSNSPHVGSMTTRQAPMEAAAAPARQYATVKRAFIPSLPDELHIALGQVVEIVEHFDDGWCLCANAHGEQGMAPVECLNMSATGAPTNGGDWRGAQRESSLYN